MCVSCDFSWMLRSWGDVLLVYHFALFKFGMFVHLLDHLFSKERKYGFAYVRGAEEFLNSTMHMRLRV